MPIPLFWGGCWILVLKVGMWKISWEINWGLSWGYNLKWGVQLETNGDWGFGVTWLRIQCCRETQSDANPNWDADQQISNKYWQISDKYWQITNEYWQILDKYWQILTKFKQILANSNYFYKYQTNITWFRIQFRAQSNGNPNWDASQQFPALAQLWFVRKRISFSCSLQSDCNWQTLDFI